MLPRILASAALAVTTLGATCLVSLPAQAQSFSCGGRLNVTEQAICADGELREWDARVARLYYLVNSSGDRALRQRNKRDQRAFLARRNACNGVRACIMRAYDSRRSQMRAY